MFLFGHSYLLFFFQHCHIFKIQRNKMCTLTAATCSRVPVSSSHLWHWLIPPRPSWHGVRRAQHAVIIVTDKYFLSLTERAENPALPRPDRGFSTSWRKRLYVTLQRETNSTDWTFSLFFTVAVCGVCLWAVCGFQGLKRPSSFLRLFRPLFPAADLHLAGLGAPQGTWNSRSEIK